jgi:hypothetical protein
MYDVQASHSRSDAGCPTTLVVVQLPQDRIRRCTADQHTLAHAAPAPGLHSPWTLSTAGAAGGKRPSSAAAAAAAARILEWSSCPRTGFLASSSNNPKIRDQSAPEAENIARAVTVAAAVLVPRSSLPAVAAACDQWQGQSACDIDALDLTCDVLD